MTGLFALAPAVILAVSAVTAVVIFLLGEQAVRARTRLNLVGATLKLALVAAVVPFVFDQNYPALGWEMVPGVRLELRIDTLSVFFALLSALLWLATTIYAIGYLNGGRHQRRFFGFFSLCVTATVGIAFSGNLVTFVVFYELLTLVTYPLVAHAATPQALKAARTYLTYALTGGLLVLVGTVALHTFAGGSDFASGGNAMVAEFAANRPLVATVVFWVLITGLGVKAALVPLHGWLPTAMVAPAPVSALLHAVAVVKAGAFGLVRVVDDVFGVDVARDLGVLDPLLVWAAITILYGSIRALTQSDLKRRLAFSTVSQVSYITLGLAMYGVVATTGGVVHLFHQGITKITLFFCAGLYAERLGVKTVDALAGMGRRMPWTSVAFTVGAFGMIGLPPLAGFISKWTLAQGALAADRAWVVGVLVLSAALNCAYFLPLVYRIWAPMRETRTEPLSRPLPFALMLWPAVTTAVLAVSAGLFAEMPYAPLDFAGRIAQRSYP